MRENWKEGLRENLGKGLERDLIGGDRGGAGPAGTALRVVSTSSRAVPPEVHVRHQGREDD